MIKFKDFEILFKKAERSDRLIELLKDEKRLLTKAMEEIRYQISKNPYGDLSTQNRRMESFHDAYNKREYVFDLQKKLSEILEDLPSYKES